MKKTILTLILCGFAMAQSPVTPVGDQIIFRRPIKWGGLNNIAITSATPETASAWVPLTANGVTKAATVYTLSYYGKATDSTTSTVSILIQTRWCLNSDTTSCDSLITRSGHHFMVASSSGKLIDTIPLQNQHASYLSNTTSEWYIPGANYARFLLKPVSVAGGVTVTYGGIFLMGQ